MRVNPYVFFAAYASHTEMCCISVLSLVLSVRAEALHLHRSKTGLAKLFEPRVKFATAWPQKGRTQCDLRGRQQPMLSHCCPQSERGT